MIGITPSYVRVEDTGGPKTLPGGVVLKSPCLTCSNKDGDKTKCAETCERLKAYQESSIEMIKASQERVRAKKHKPDPPAAAKRPEKPKAKPEEKPEPVGSMCRTPKETTTNTPEGRPAQEASSAGGEVPAPGQSPKKHELPLCECGCGGRVAKKGNKYIMGHNGIKNLPPAKEATDLPFCKCGCGERVTKPRNTYINGHHSKKGKDQCMNCEDPAKVRGFCNRCYQRWRARKLEGFEPFFDGEAKPRRIDELPADCFNDLACQIDPVAGEALDMGDSVRVGENDCPELWPLIKKLAKNWHLPMAHMVLNLIAYGYAAVTKGGPNTK